MPAATIVPIIARLSNNPVLQPVEGSVVPDGVEHSLDIRAANTSTAEVLVRVAIVPPGGGVAEAGIRVPDVKVPANEARDLERGLTLPAGWSLYARQSGAAGAVDLTVTGRKRSTGVV